jgi:MoaA/NifB/PqqE/SkfB family radical SAM enzyme
VSQCFKNCIFRDSYLKSATPNFLASELQQLKKDSNIEVTTYQDSADDSCSCGVTQLTLRPNGDVSVCPYSSDVLGNLTEITLTDLWKTNSVLVNRRKAEPSCIGNYSTSYPYNPGIEIIYTS